MSNDSNTFLGILAGTAIGAALGILFAPERGSVTRQRLADQAANTKDHLTDSAIDLKEKVLSTVTDKKQTLDTHLDTIVSDVSYKTEDVITSLENKLAQLKLQNKKLQKK
ncbi:YtxH domain-containing protein [Ascidiimonas sp. W6]|uniref:YtxH domain-containing protein n=1 Tax=Ascidiimonas meishanensis TaxID=3128903 RepID=UPI0030EE2CB0